ncbi:3' terminal RNA ribose 2'-O-methyltransferase Hen1 [Dactylosporangium vinaceum]|uniref:Small RNA 2'-O-methyltransferase n=1 Tax=Dactylosporangium vinaceum TaxID=53362 RepID=A0ABV5MIS2_9ACTN|nr:3' terminal RNA ribose 2'-O-methyltransferase Hen1 [Dactylosporangium vinaceum]UAB93820.1 3' terminal RNA ribose 2'-O-methyltransferase Hen1 [Dactylosporangium vinaceum]
MLLTISTTLEPATELGFLLHKHPGKVQEFDVAVGRAHVFYPEASQGRCTAALLVEVDPVGLVRGRRGVGAEGFSLAQYVNDRPYAASSMLSVAIARVFKSAMAGRCDARPELARRALPLEITVPALPCAGGAEVAERVFGPLGWEVAAAPVALDPLVPQWGDSRYVDLTLRGEVRLADALNHLYVLLPVLDNAKHYWVSIDEVDKLIRAGDGWLGTHPERELITRRYLAHRRELVATAVGRLAEVDDTAPEELDNAVPPEDEAPVRTSLAAQRLAAVVDVLREAGAARVVDLGCGEGALIRVLLDDPAMREVLGVDVSHRALQIAARRLRLERMGDRRRERVHLLQSSLTYRDDRLAGFDAAVLMEVIEHLDPPRLPALEHVVFGLARPSTVVVTTPNVEYNSRFAGLEPGRMRHRDHRFEWSRSEFRAWADRVADGHGYRVRYRPVGAQDPEAGPPTQMAVFSLAAPEEGTP